MPRARNKQQLLEFGEKEFNTLQQIVKDFSDEELTKKEVFPQRTVKDIFAHLLAWQKLSLTWHQEGMKGKKPAIPAEGYTFKDAPALNEKLYQEYEDLSWQKIWKELTSTHQRHMEIIDSHSDEELTEKQKYAWTGSTNLASYLASATSSHYLWANDLLKKYKKRVQ